MVRWPGAALRRGSPESRLLGGPLLVPTPALVPRVIAAASPWNPSCSAVGKKMVTLHVLLGAQLLVSEGLCGHTVGEEHVPCCPGASAGGAEEEALRLADLKWPGDVLVTSLGPEEHLNSKN